MTREEYIEKYWETYLMKEKKFTKSTEYITLSTFNYDAFSEKYITLIKDIGSEVDVMMKVLSGFNLSDYKKMDDYANEILNAHSDIKQQGIDVQGKWEIKPFETWKPMGSPEWWSAYNKIKHARSDNERKANQKNTLFLLGALFILNMYTLKYVVHDADGIDAVEVESRLFKMKDWKQKFSFSDNGKYLLEEY